MQELFKFPRYSFIQRSVTQLMVCMKLIFKGIIS